MRIFTLGAHGFVEAHVIAALGLPAHHKVARVLIPARSKVDAVLSATACGIIAASHDPELCEATGVDVDALTGVLTAPQVYVVGPVGESGPVLRIEPNGDLVCLGLLLHIPLVKSAESNPAGGMDIVVATPPETSGRMRFYPLPDGTFHRPMLEGDLDRILVAFRSPLPTRGANPDHLAAATTAAERALSEDPRLRFLTDDERRLAAAIAVKASVTSVEALLRGKWQLLEEWRVSVPATKPGMTGRRTWATSFNEDAAWADHAQCVKEGRWGAAEQVWVERHFAVPDGTPWVRVHRQSGGGAQR